MRSLSLGRAFGIPLFIHPTFLLLPLYVAFATRGEPLPKMALAQGLLLSMFFCVLLHELGHALMARRFRIHTRDITLYPIGGVARLESTGHAPHQEVAIALAGPAVNLALVALLAPLAAALALLGDPADPLAALESGPAGYLAVLAVGNAMLLAFNLIPAFPMDGGRVLRALLSLPLGLLRATEVAAAVGLVLGLGMAVCGLTVSWASPSLALVGLFVVFAGRMELASLRRAHAHRRLEGERRQAPAVEVVMRAADPFDPLAPLRPAGEVVPSRGGFTGFLYDTEQRVWVRWIDGRPVEAF